MVQKWTSLCKGTTTNTQILETFQDNMDKEVKAAGPIFCEPLNGKLIGFPETMDEFKEILDFKTKFMSLKKILMQHTKHKKYDLP